MSLIRSLLAALGVLVLCSCQPTRYEGQEPGDCTDGADNDADGTYDCLDEGCLTSPDCIDTGSHPGVLEDTPLCDAGDEAFVRRLVPQLWGRHPRSVREIDLLVQIIEQSDRATLVSKMMGTAEFLLRWSEVLKDFLLINRVGERAGRGCATATQLVVGALPASEFTGSLAASVRDNAPDDAPEYNDWDLTELLVSAIVLDDISPIYRAHLFAQLGSKLINLDNPGANLAWRGAYAEMFEQTHLNRRMGCMGCHNSEFSATDAADPELDRTWQVPGYFEKAIYGDSGGRPVRDLAAFFRVEGVLSMQFLPEGFDPTLYWDYGEGFNPWGMGEFCGEFVLPDDVEDDPEGWTGYFIEEVIDRPSIWHLERWLRDGFEALREDGLQVGDDLSVDGKEAFAWMVSMSTAEKVWTEITGKRLTTPHFFARNRYQRDLLKYLTDVYVDNSFSLKALVQAVVLHPYFNPGAPEQCEGVETPYYLAPIFNPWFVNHLIPELRLNNPGDSVERLPARVLMGALVSAMDWTDIDSQIYGHFFDEDGNFAPGQELPAALIFEFDIGIFLLDGETGFRSSNFAESMAWEEAVGSCVDPFPTEEEPRIDWIDRLVSEAPNTATMEELVLALKDRLIARPVLDDETERGLIEALLQLPLDSPVGGLKDPTSALRRVCSALLSSGDFLLAGAPGPEVVGTELSFTPSGSSSRELCESLVESLFEFGQASCDESGRIQLSGTK